MVKGRLDQNKTTHNYVLGGWRFDIGVVGGKTTKQHATMFGRVERAKRKLNISRDCMQTFPQTSMRSEAGTAL